MASTQRTNQGTVRKPRGVETPKAPETPDANSSKISEKSSVSRNSKQPSATKKSMASKVSSSGNSYKKLKPIFDDINKNIDDLKKKIALFERTSGIPLKKDRLEREMNKLLEEVKARVVGKL